MEIMIGLLIAMLFIVLVATLCALGSGSVILDGKHKATCPGGGTRGCNCGLDAFLYENLYKK